ncbi:hypothetical protein AAKU55_001639 [Oxalobacteraceae bacterium GrIS 1.11]
MNTSPIGAPASTRKKPAALLVLPSWLGELGLIRLALGCFTLSLALAGLVISVSNVYLNRQSEQLAQAQQLRAVAFDKFNHVENEKLEIRSYQPQFIALRDKGLIGEENRLAWVDAIRQIQERRRLLPINYEIDVQQKVKLEARMALGDYHLRASRMDLHMDLLHEMDLFNFLDDLKRRSYYALQDCSLRRNAVASGGTITPTLAADCTLYWLTLGVDGPTPSPAPKAGK